MFLRRPVIICYRNIRKMKHILFKKQLGFTNTTIGFILYGCGDLTGQLCIEKQKKINYQRLFACALWGGTISSLSHFLFKTLHYIPYFKHYSHRQSVFLFLTICPLEDGVYYAATGFVEGQDTSYIKEEIKAKFLPTLCTDVFAYYPFLYVNVRFVPYHLKVTANNVYSFGWSIFLSYMKHDVDNQLHQQILENN
ncbi:uncharacterized protein LOC130648670 [Hydractinia symbiolongicarpus]|uniref:uncharacterized protein LOC130648670 n=1 Tax=Hydractinia symbiolongicarpus TaxID=13093 RepID=UPI00254BC463|nr:uncharacterized protein LOC130648670 [Hydractinia symbiolongicarpus]